MCLDILGARDIETDQKITVKFQKMIKALHQGEPIDGLYELDMLMRDHMESELATAYEVVISYRSRYYHHPQKYESNDNQGA
jgi:hypothetical protein